VLGVAGGGYRAGLQPLVRIDEQVCRPWLLHQLLDLGRRAQQQLVEAHEVGQEKQDGDGHGGQGRPVGEWLEHG
jgi:hypothetical protein